MNRAKFIYILFFLSTWCTSGLLGGFNRLASFEKEGRNLILVFCDSDQNEENLREVRKLLTSRAYLKFCFIEHDREAYEGFKGAIFNSGRGQAPRDWRPVKLSMIEDTFEGFLGEITRPNRPHIWFTDSDSSSVVEEILRSRGWRPL